MQTYRDPVAIQASFSRTYSAQECAEIIYPYVFKYIDLRQRITLLLGVNKAEHLTQDQFKGLKVIFGFCLKSKMYEWKLSLVQNVQNVLYTTIVSARSLIACLEMICVQRAWLVTRDDLTLNLFRMLVPYQHSFIEPHAIYFYSSLRKAVRCIERRLQQDMRASAQPIPNQRQFPVVARGVGKRRVARGISFENVNTKPKKPKSQLLRPKPKVININEKPTYDEPPINFFKDGQDIVDVTIEVDPKDIIPDFVTCSNMSVKENLPTDENVPPTTSVQFNCYYFDPLHAFYSTPVKFEVPTLPENKTPFENAVVLKQVVLKTEVAVGNGEFPANYASIYGKGNSDKNQRDAAGKVPVNNSVDQCSESGTSKDSN